jgi:hypothetical protein
MVKKTIMVEIWLDNDAGTSNYIQNELSKHLFELDYAGVDTFKITEVTNLSLFSSSLPAS